MATWKSNIGAYQGDESALDWPNNIGAFQTDESTTTPLALSGTIAGESSLSADLSLSKDLYLSGTVTAQSSVSGNLGYKYVVLSQPVSTIKRICAIGNNRLFYEDI